MRPSLRAKRSNPEERRSPADSGSPRRFAPRDDGFRLNAALLNEAVALGMIFRHWRPKLAQRLFDRIHHHIRPADEVLMVGKGRRQMTLEDLGVDTALFAGPARRRIGKHMHDRQVEPLTKRLELLAE